MAQKINAEIEQFVINLYNNNFKVGEIASKYGIHRATVQRILMRNGIELRKSTPDHFYNIEFFNQYTPESCYWAGFIAADGYVRSDRNCVAVHLSIADYEHLEKLAFVTGFIGSPKINKKACALTFNGEWYVKALEKNFGIKPQKTFDTNIPDMIPKHLVKHFIRGYFDGDGCVTNMKQYLHVSFTSGSLTILNQIMDYFYESGIRIRNASGKPNIQKDTQIDYFCKNALDILDIMYSESIPITRLDRKYDLYQKWRNENVCDGQA